MRLSVKSSLLSLVLVASLAGPAGAQCPVGDLNRDCRVDSQDLLVLAQQWLDASCSGPTCADLDGANGVDATDFALLAEGWFGAGEITLAINELMAKNNSWIQDPHGDYDDWIEIYNYGDDAIDMGGMYLTDNLSSPTKWRVPDNNPSATTIPSGGYLLIWADEEGGEGTLHANFKLGAGGEEIGLYDAGRDFVDSVTFGPQNDDESYGRLPDGSDNWRTFTSPTPSTPNVGEPMQVIISEIMYHPYSEQVQAEDIREEYIELFNRGTEPVNLSGWRFTDGVDFVFPDMTLGGGEYLVVAADVDTFTTKYPGVTNVVGGWGGRLSNSGEVIELADSIAGRVDQVRYADQGEWAVRELGPEDYGHRGWTWIAQHDGGRKSLELINPALPNDYGQNWATSKPDDGTPGMINSVADDDIAPLVVDVTHWPVIPGPNDPVIVSARIIDELSTDVTATLRYRVDASMYEGEDVYPHHGPNDYNYVAMFDDGAHGDGEAADGVYGAQIPAQPDGTVIEFYVEASDAGANSRTWPAASMVDGVPEQVTNALYQVNDSFDAGWAPGSQPIYYLIMTEMERGRLEYIGTHSTLTGPDSQMNATFISVDGVDVKMRYNVGVRNRGHGTRDNPPNNYRVNFVHDRPWKDVTAINLNAKYTYLQLAGNAIFSISGVAQPEATAVQVRVNGQNLAEFGREMYGSYVHIEVIDSDWAGNHFPDDGGGNAYKCMRDAGPADLSYRGPDPDSYRNSYFKRTNTGVDDWSDLIELTYVLSNTPDHNYVEEVNRVVDVEQWLRFLAINALLDNSETTLANGVGDDYFLYCGVENPRCVLIQHDVDSILGMGQSSGSSTTSGIFRATGVATMDRFLRHPVFVQRYYWHLRNLIETTFSAERFGPFVDNLLGDFVPTGTIDQMRQFVTERNAHVLSLIPSDLTIGTDLPQSDGYYQSDANVVVLYGTADAVETGSVLVNGHLAEWSPVDGEWWFGGTTTVMEKLVKSGSVWKYLDDGSDGGTSTDGSNWFGHPDYNDLLWSEGRAELGYGDASQGRPEVTEVNSGPEDNHFITTYFRHSFDVADTSQYLNLTLRLLCDDGAVVYLNGVEAAGPSNMPPGPIDYLTPARSGVAGSAEYTFSDFTVDVSLLSEGTNVLAVEVHQASPTSADISFDLELLAETVEGRTTRGAALDPGINRVIVQTFDGPDGAGNELDSGYIDIWYDDGDVVEIFGTLGADTMLDAASGPWLVTDDVTVPAGVTLTIEPGTTLFFDSDKGISVDGGRLVVEGAQYRRIRLTRVPEIGSSWRGLSFTNSLQDSRLSYADMEFGDGQGESINISYSQVLIDNMTWAGTDRTVLDMHHPSVTIRNSYIPGVDSEPIHGTHIEADEYLILEGNVFGAGAGSGDIIDWDTTGDGKPYFIAIDNMFLGGGDDGIDLDGSDAYLEGNVFMNFHSSDTSTTSNAVSGGQAYSGAANRSDMTLVRNIFVDVDHALLIKGEAYATIINNVFLDSTDAAIQFWEPEGRNPHGPAKGAYIDGNIFWKYDHLFNHQFPEEEPGEPEYPDPDIVINRSIVPGAFHYLGQGNIDADPIFVDPDGDFHLKAVSPAIGTGPCGLDMGAYVPSGAAICGEPGQITYHTDTTLTVGGPGITHYRWALNDPNGPFSEEQPIDVPIELTGLADGQSYTVYAIGKNSAGIWQSEPAASRTWTIDTSYRQLVINEVLARNLGAVEHQGTLPDVIELYYDGPASLSLSGMSISDDPADRTKYIFPAGITMGPGEYLVLYADADTTTSGIHLGFGLDGDGDEVYLYDRSGALLDSVEFGLQLADLSIGRLSDGQWHLTVPTFGQANIAQPLGDPDTLKINEWLARGEVLFEDDFIELFNPHTAPVDLSGLYLTDNPVTQPDKHQIGPLNFVGGEGFAIFRADDSNDPGHVDFRLSADGEMIGLFDAEVNEIDKVLYGPQTTDVSQGRAPDGGDYFAFFELPTPGVANPVSATSSTTLVTENADKRVLVPTGDIGDAWRTEPDFDDSGWALCTGNPGGVGFETDSGYESYITLDVEAEMYNTNATCYIRIPFTVDSDPGAFSDMVLRARYDDGFVAYINGVGVARPNFAGVPQWDSDADRTHSDSDAVVFEDIDIFSYIDAFRQGDNILAIHGMNASTTSSDFLISAELVGTVITSQDEFVGKSLALLDGLRVTELMYHASSGSNYDFVELQNISDVTLELTGVRFTDGIEFTFPDMTLEPGAYVVVVSNLAAFRSRYGMGVNVAGVYSGNFSNGGEQVILRLAFPLEAAILRFEYNDSWYPTTDGGGDSLVAVDVSAYPAVWSEPESWQPSTPTPGSP